MGLWASCDDCFQDRSGRGSQSQGSRGRRRCTAARRIVRTARLYAEARAAQDLRGLLALLGALAATPGAFLVLPPAERNPRAKQTEIANTLGILRPNFVAMLDGL